MGNFEDNFIITVLLSKVNNPIKVIFDIKTLKQSDDKTIGNQMMSNIEVFSLKEIGSLNDMLKGIAEFYKSIKKSHVDYTNVSSYSTNEEIAYLMALMLQRGFLRAYDLT